MTVVSGGELLDALHDLVRSEHCSTHQYIHWVLLVSVIAASSMLQILNIGSRYCHPVNVYLVSLVFSTLPEVTHGGDRNAYFEPICVTRFVSFPRTSTLSTEVGSTDLLHVGYPSKLLGAEVSVVHSAGKEGGMGRGDIVSGVCFYEAGARGFDFWEHCRCCSNSFFSALST